MKKNMMNFWIDVLTFIDFIAVLFTGILLREFPPTLSGATILGVSRYDWADLHWVLSLSLILFIFTHLVLHWNWAKVSFKNYIRVGPRTLVITTTVVVVFCAIVAPVYLTKDFPSRKDVKAAYPKASSFEVDKKDGGNKC